MNMKCHPNKATGYSLIELLVVLAIITILAIAAVSVVGNRQAVAVRAVMDQVEGVLAAAHKQASTGADVTLSTDGVWGNSTFLTYTGALAPADSFRYVLRSREYDYAGIACGTTWADDAITSLKKVAPTDTAPFLGALDLPLFTGAANPTAAMINGYNKRYNQGFYIAIVGLRGSTPPIPVISGPVGVIVVPAGSGSIYKFYRSNSADTWRRL